MYIFFAILVTSCFTFIACLNKVEIQSFGTSGHINPDTGIAGWVNVQNNAADGTLTLTSNGLPDHDAPDIARNPNNISVQNYAVTFPRNPNYDDTNKWCLNMGPIGFAKNGIPIFNAFTSDNIDAILAELFDPCEGHPAAAGNYHYHQQSPCVVDPDTHQGAFVGVALDGHPIYGIDDSVPVGDLDECQGRLVDGVYRYQLTKTYPYTLGCYRSVPIDPKTEGPKCVFLDRDNPPATPAPTTTRCGKRKNCG